MSVFIQFCTLDPGLNLYVVNVSSTSLMFFTVLMQRHGEVSGKAAGSLGV